MLSDYKGPDGKIVNLYVAYYSSQRKSDHLTLRLFAFQATAGKINKIERKTYAEDGTEFPLNRVVIEKNSIKQIVYYWFDERGRKFADEFLAKWYLLADAVVLNRTDGALVRLTTQIYDGETERDADQRLQTFMRDVVPILTEYLPSEVASQVKSARFTESTHYRERRCRNCTNGIPPRCGSALLGLSILGLIGVSCFLVFGAWIAREGRHRDYYEHGVKLAEQR